ncbi:MAG: quinolinate synthase NadA [Nitrospirae bacterium]|nr:quinolinate synthase NadA [Nitrospirota bacterium]
MNTLKIFPIEDYLELTAGEIGKRIFAAKDALKSKLLILGHHYQQDDVIKFADFTGDSLKLSQEAAGSESEFIVFCGVHFMAETADIITEPHQKVILPDLTAGCSMADMADLYRVEKAWKEIANVSGEDSITPVTYINSSADLKAFCGKKNGSICTSSIADRVMKWALGQREKVFFFPDEHLGRNSAFKLGIPEDEIIVWRRDEPFGGNTEEDIRRAKVILWNGFCSVHMLFLPKHVEYFREKYRELGVNIIVHPECRRDVVAMSDLCGSTEYIIKTIKAAPSGTVWAIGTEINLVNRLKKEEPDKTIFFLSPTVCLCSTMYRIDPQHLCWVLENLIEGNIVNQVIVSDEEKRWAKVALERMLGI